MEIIYYVTDIFNDVKTIKKILRKFNVRIFMHNIVYNFQNTIE